MQMINKTCNKISRYISNELDLTEEQREVINYGIFGVIQMSICIILVLIVGRIFNVLIESLIVSFTISILRKSTGGAHASSPERCAVIGTICSVVLALMSKAITIDFKYVIIISVLIFSWTLYLIIKEVPVDSIAKPIKNPAKRKKLKKYSIITLLFYVAIVVVMSLCYFLSYKSYLITYLWCILMGVLWQSITLTKLFHTVLNKFSI